MNKQEWLADRQAGIGGSEASAIVGMNPYINNVQLWRIKTGRNASTVNENASMAYGIAAEAPLITLFGLDYPNYHVIPQEPYTLRKNAQYPFILGTVDAELENKVTHDKGFLEIKTTTIATIQQKSKWEGKIPDNYYIQCLHYMLVNPKYEFFFLKVQIKPYFTDDNFIITTKHYDFGNEQKQVQEDLKMLLEKEIEFWNYVVRDEEPPLVLPQL